MKKKENELKVLFLGGVGEIGKNMTALECGDDIIIIDCGSIFPTESMPGIDLVIPDFTYLMERKDKVRGVLLTHGHEDHIGSLPYLLKELNVPVFATKLTLMLVENKLKEHRLQEVDLNCVKPGTKLTLGCFETEFINVNHSIAGAVALAIRTPQGVVFHSGDFKMDHTPVAGEPMDLKRISEIGKEGVTLFLCESTNIERPGYTMSERVVGQTLDGIFAENVTRRLIIATFASNVHRLQQILDLAKKYGRKVAFSGRSMINVAEAALSIGELSYNAEDVVDIEKIKKIPDKELVILCTGSQGEPMSALTRMASGEFNRVKVDGNDTVILSASPIPGNEKSVYRVINNLYRLGAEVIYESLENVHVSGHACKEELKLLHTLLKPKYFMPVHGEYRHLKKHVDLAVSLGLNPACALIAQIGSAVSVTQKQIKFTESFHAGATLVDGDSMDGNDEILADRRHMAEDGLLVLALTLSAGSGELLAPPKILCRGFLAEGLDKLLTEGAFAVTTALSSLSKATREEVIVTARRALKNCVYRSSKQNPVIVTAVTEI
ncbi:MAG: ribonuclease J [Clostridiales bacterium]|nr:ribonuclease J [Clostridiales bacterium]